MARKEVTRIEKVLNVWGITLIIWALYRAYFKTELPLWVDEFIAKPLVFIGPAFYFIFRNEKVNFLEAVGLKFKKIGKDLIFGLVIGAGLFLLILMTTIKKIEFNQSLFYFGLVALAAAISEEILSRGFVLRRLYEESKNIWTSSFFASILFFFLHVPILFTMPGVSGDLLLRVMVTDLVLSLALSFLFILRGNLIVPILVHAFYALSIYLSLAN